MEVSGVFDHKINIKIKQSSIKEMERKLYVSSIRKLTLIL